MKGVIRENYPNKTYKEIANMLGVSAKSVERQLCNMGLVGQKRELMHQNKQTIRTIGSRRRASNKYNAIVSRIRGYNNKKNNSYIGIKLLVSREDFILWYMPLDFEGASVDRIDKNGHYELSNMQVIPLDENIRKDKVKAQNDHCECYVCKTTKPLEEFSVDNRRKNGRSTICKACENIRGKEKYHRLKSKKHLQ